MKPNKNVKSRPHEQVEKIHEFSLPVRFSYVQTTAPISHTRNFVNLLNDKFYG